MARPSCGLASGTVKPLWKFALFGLGIVAGAEVVHDGVRRIARHRLPPQPPQEVVSGRVLWIGDRGNGGEPVGADDVDLRHDGWTSADWAERLPEWLALHAPAVVRVCVGAEDLRRRDDRVAAPEAPRLEPHGFRSFWLGLLRDPPRTGNDSSDGAPFLGVWHLGQIVVEFRADGACRLGDVGGFWSVGGGATIRMELVGAAPFEVEYSLGGDDLTLRGAGVGGTFPLRRGAPPELRGDLVAEAIRRGNTTEARHLLGPSRMGALRDPSADVLWVEVNVADGDLESAREGLTALRANAEGSVDGRRKLARALLALGRVEEALDVTGQDLASFCSHRPFRGAVLRAAIEAHEMLVVALRRIAEPNADVHWLMAELGDSDSERLLHLLHWSRLAGSEDVREAPSCYAELPVGEVAARAEATGFDDAAAVRRLLTLREGWRVADEQTSTAWSQNVELMRQMVAGVEGCELSITEEGAEPRLERVRDR